VASQEYFDSFHHGIEVCSKLCKLVMTRQTFAGARALRSPDLTRRATTWIARMGLAIWYASPKQSTGISKSTPMKIRVPRPRGLPEECLSHSL